MFISHRDMAVIFEIVFEHREFIATVSILSVLFYTVCEIIISLVNHTPQLVYDNQNRIDALDQRVSNIEIPCKNEVVLYKYKGGKIHTTPRCNRRFKPERITVDVSLWNSMSRAFFCKKCVDNEPSLDYVEEGKYDITEDVYITAEGGKFHDNINCSSLRNRNKSKHILKNNAISLFDNLYCKNC